MKTNLEPMVGYKRWQDQKGRWRRAVEAASADLASAAYAWRDVLVSLIGEVARNHVEVRGFQRRRLIVRQNLRAQEDIPVITRDRFKNGLADDLDVERVATILSTTQAGVPTLEGGLKASIYQPGVLLTRAPDALQEELSANTPIPSAPPKIPVGLPSELLLRRADVRRAERKLAAGTVRIGVPKSDLFPKFFLTGAPGMQSISVGDWFTSGSRLWLAGPAMQWRIFDFGRIRSNIRVQTARQGQALAAYENTVLISFEDVESALVAYAKEQIRRRSLDDAAGTSEDALRQSTDLYTNGLSSFLDVLDAERTLNQAQVDPDLMEWDYGQYEGLTSAEIHAMHPDWLLFRDGCPDGETPAQVVARADRVIERARAPWERAGAFKRTFSPGAGGSLARTGSWLGRLLLPVERGERKLRRRRTESFPACDPVVEQRSPRGGRKNVR